MSQGNHQLCPYPAEFSCVATFLRRRAAIRRPGNKLEQTKTFPQIWTVFGRNVRPEAHDFVLINIVRAPDWAEEWSGVTSAGGERKNPGLGGRNR
jgi:hypothetical protein